MFKKAERKQAKLKLAITGPSGSGKTYSALLIAKGLGSKIALIDTENGSGSLYADNPDMPSYDVLDIGPPFTIEKYVQAIHAAVTSGYEVLVIDSLTHAWAGEGGLLEQKEVLDSRNKNSYANWGSITKLHEAFKSSILQSDIHIICTMRSKQDYAQVEENGRKSVKKLGMAPIQRDGLEYEFTVVFDMAMDHSTEASKDRTGLFDKKIFKPSVETGKTILAWLQGGLEVEKKKPPVIAKSPIVPLPGQPQLDELKECMKVFEWKNTDVIDYMKEKYGVQKISQLSDGEFKELKETVSTMNLHVATAAMLDDQATMFDAQDKAL